MSVITLLTDFGTDDEYVGIMKGVILSLNLSATIVDITHQVDHQDLVQAAYLIESSYRYFPKGTIHVIVVDPGVGSAREILCVRTNEYIFLAPNNGVLTLLMEKKDAEIFQVENPKYFLDSVSQTFHGRDIFAPVAAHLSKGIDIKKIGSPFAQENMVRLPIQKTFISDKGELIGHIVSVDRFGNLITNIDMESLEKFQNSGMKKSYEIQIGENKITGLSKSYASMNLRQPLAIIGSRGYLEIAVNCGNARAYFKAEKGDKVKVL